MIKVIQNNVFSRVISFETKAEEVNFRRAMKFRMPGYIWTRRYQRHAWDGFLSFYNKRSGLFPTGMLYALSPELTERLVISDQRIVPEMVRSLNHLDGMINVELRDYQIEAIERATELGRCAIQSPTGSGKTEIAIGITFCLGVRTLFCVHLANLLWQAKERFEKRLGIECGIINADYFEPKDVTIAMIPTLYHRLRKGNKKVEEYLANEVDCIFLDETHHLGSAESWEKPAKKCNAYYRFGLSGTVLLRDEISNMRLIGQTGQVITSTTQQELVRRGLSAFPIIRMISNKTLLADATDWSWRQVYRVGIEENDIRNRIILDIIDTKIEEKKQTLIIVHTVRHANQLMKNARQYKRMKLITGAVEGQERQRLVKQMDRGELLCIVATPVFDEGVDIPNLRCLILAGGGKSPIKVIQRMGRGMRQKPEGANIVEIYDFLDNGNKYIRRHAQQRKRVFHREGFETETFNWV